MMTDELAVEAGQVGAKRYWPAGDTSLAQFIVDAERYAQSAETVLLSDDATSVARERFRKYYIGSFTTTVVDRIRMP